MRNVPLGEAEDRLSAPVEDVDDSTHEVVRITRQVPAVPDGVGRLA